MLEVVSIFANLFPGSDPEIARKVQILFEMKNNVEQNLLFPCSSSDLDYFQIPSWNSEAERRNAEIWNSQNWKP